MNTAKAPYKNAWTTLFIVDLRQCRPELLQGAQSASRRAAWQPAQAQAPFVDALAQVRVSPSRHALNGPFVAKPVVAIAFGAARDHDALGMMASQGKVDE